MRDIVRYGRIIFPWFLSAGLVLALAANIYQFVQSRELSRELGAMERRTQKQIADLREADSAVMEQSVRRTQAVSDELHQMAIATMDLTNSQLDRNSARLARAMDGRHREIAGQISSLRTDLSTDTTHRLNQVSSQLEKTGLELEQVVADLGAMHTEVANPVHEQAAPSIEQPKPAVVQPVKKPFWARFNLFHKKKTEASLTGLD